MNWIKVDDALPLAGKEVLLVLSHRTHRYYALGYYCCRSGWKHDSSALNDEVIMWSELPAIVPE